MWLQRLKRFLPLISLLLFLFALWALHRALGPHSIHDVLAELRQFSAENLGFAVLLTALSYSLLICYDILALRHLGYKLPLGKVGLGSFVSYVLAHNIGMSMVSGGSMRYRIYSAAGVATLDIAYVTLMCGLTFGLGAMALTGAALLAEPAGVLAVLPMGVTWQRVLGVACLVCVVAYLGWTVMRRSPVRLGEWQLPAPSFDLTAKQIVLSLLDITIAGAALYTLVPSHDVGFLSFLGVFTLAIVGGVIAHVPAGLGVIETIMITMLPQVPADRLFAALLAYRVIYYFLPLMLAGLLLAIYETSARWNWLPRVSSAMGWLVGRLTPTVLGTLVFLAGLVLLISGVTPGVADRLVMLSRHLPLSLLEVSHMLGSLTGVVLLFLARGLFRRIDVAWIACQALLAAGIVFSLLKGLDWEEATILAMVMACLYAGRSAFYRRASLWEMRFTWNWLATLAIFIGGTIWLGLFCYNNVAYSNHLWWEFAFKADAPRFLRASLLVVIAAVAMAFSRMMRPAPPSRAVPLSSDDMLRVEEIVARSPVTEANLALLGDKRFLFSESGQSFIMYGVQGSSWIALGDPVGPHEEASDLLWQYRELCDRHGGRPVFYQVSPERLPLYIDLGLSLFKLGEEARVNLRAFRMEGGESKDLRYARRKAVKDGLTFEVCFPPAVRGLIPELRAISDAWLQDKRVSEKAFSLGAFIPEFLAHFPCALVRRHDELVAFATIWPGAEKAEASVDLMRYTANAPNGVMDFLFTELLIWAKEEGYAWFDLGMAPLAGLENHPLAPLWHQLGTAIFRNGENFYNFDGLRRFKAKFHPEWVPKYLACQGGLAVPPILVDVTALISGGYRRLLPASANIGSRPTRPTGPGVLKLRISSSS